MSREKWLWGLCGVLAAVAAVLAFLLFSQPGAPAAAPPGGPQQGAEPEGGAGAGAGEAPQQRVIARAGSAVLYEEEFADGLRKAYGKEYVRQWLKRAVVRLEAQALGINVARGDIDREIRRMQAGYESEAEFFRIMREQLGMTEQDLRDDALYRLMLEAIATANVTVTEADVEAYIREHPEEFAPMRDIRYAQIVVETLDRAERVMEQLAKGVEFALLAKDVSLDDATSAWGGDSGWVSVDDPFIPAPIMDELETMEVGGVSGPIPLEDGTWAIVTLLGRRTINPLDDSGVRDELRRELALAAAPSLFEVEQKLLEKYNAVDFLGGD
mgnify:CR=1 FL=1